MSLVSANVRCRVMLRLQRLMGIIAWGILRLLITSLSKCFLILFLKLKLFNFALQYFKVILISARRVWGELIRLFYLVVSTLSCYKGGIFDFIGRRGKSFIISVWRLLKIKFRHLVYYVIALLPLQIFDIFFVWLLCPFGSLRMDLLRHFLNIVVFLITFFVLFAFRMGRWAIRL